MKYDNFVEHTHLDSLEFFGISATFYFDFYIRPTSITIAKRISVNSYSTLFSYIFILDL